MNATKPGVEQPSIGAMAFALLVIGASVVWIGVVWSVGVGQLVQAHGIRHDRLTEVVFPIWNTRPISTHFFAGALSREAFDAGKVYTGYPPVMLMTWYAIASLSERLFSGALGHATNTMPFVGAGVLAAVTGWLARSSRFVQGRWSATRLGLFTLLLGFVLTSRSLWIEGLLLQADNPNPLAASLLVPLIPFAVEGQAERRRAATVALVLLALFSPIFTPIVLVTLAVYCRPLVSSWRESRRLALTAAVAGALAVAGFVGPRFIAGMAGQQTDNSSWALRSGLDGEREFLTTILGAIADPYINHLPTIQWGYWPRSGLDLLGMPAVLLVSAVIVALTRPAWRGHVSQWVPKAGLLLLAPYLFSVVFFAQSVTHHPYIYDYLLQLPLALLGGATMLHMARDDDDGRLTLFFGWLLAAGIMTNLIGIAQAARLALHPS